MYTFEIIISLSSFIIGSLISFLWSQVKYKGMETLLNKLSFEKEVITQKLEQERKESESIISDLKVEFAKVQTQLVEGKKSHDEKIKLLEDSKKDLKVQFENLANETLEKNSKKFVDQNEKQINQLLNPFKKDIQDFKKKVEESYINESKERFLLKAGIEDLKKLNLKMSEDAVNLTKALKGDKKLQGNWGEMILERVLESSGLRKNHEYEVQKEFKSDENERFRPDVIIHLPEDKDIIIDSKVSLNAYNDYVRSEDIEERKRFLKAHIESTKNHVKSLSEKDYSELKGIRSLDFILMFMPIEPAFNLAFENDEYFFSMAFKKKIVIVTPTTLMATLKTIENIWRNEWQNRNTEEIVSRATKLLDKLNGFLEIMEKLGLQIDSLQGTYKTTMNKLSSGNGNLIQQAQKLEKLGIKPKKQIPSKMLSNSQSS